jgi:hypothetical protein
LQALGALIIASSRGFAVRKFVYSGLAHPKTLTSIYLANRGIRTADVPLEPGIPLPHQLVQLFSSQLAAEARAFI